MAIRCSSSVTASSSVQERASCCCFGASCCCLHLPLQLTPTAARGRSGLDLEVACLAEKRASGEPCVRFQGTFRCTHNHTQCVHQTHWMHKATQLAPQTTQCAHTHTQYSYTPHPPPRIRRGPEAHWRAQDNLGPRGPRQLLHPLLGGMSPCPLHWCPWPFTAVGVAVGGLCGMHSTTCTWPSTPSDSCPGRPLAQRQPRRRPPSAAACARGVLQHAKRHPASRTGSTGSAPAGGCWHRQTGTRKVKTRGLLQLDLLFPQCVRTVGVRGLWGWVWVCISCTVMLTRHFTQRRTFFSTGRRQHRRAQLSCRRHRRVGTTDGMSVVVIWGLQPWKEPPPAPRQRCA